MFEEIRVKSYAVHAPALTKKEWEDYCERNGHPPSWQPHEQLTYKNTKDE